MKRLLACLIVPILVPAPGMAATLRLELSGTAYQGGPAFEVSFGNAVVGRGLVDPLPEAGQGESFEFDLPDLLLASRPDLRIRLTNDAWEGPGRDRNLYVLGVAVDGSPVPIDTFRVARGDELRNDRLRQGHLEIWSGQEVAVAPAPAGGWPIGLPVLRPAFAVMAFKAGE